MVNGLKSIFNYTYFLTQFILLILLVVDHRLDYAKDVIAVNAFVAAFIAIESRYNIYVSNYVRICTMLTVTLHNFAGKYLELYLTSLIFDKALHVMGIYSLALLLLTLIEQIMDISFSSKYSLFFFVFLLGIGLGAVYEIIEFLLDITIKPKIPNQPSLIDTDLDLIADLFGALLASLHGANVDAPLWKRSKNNNHR